MVDKHFNAQEQWPELFTELTDEQSQEVVAALGTAWSVEGREPDREDVENLTDLTRGAIDRAEFDRREQRKSEPPAPPTPPGAEVEFNVEGRWPELFEKLTDDERESVVEPLASSWHEGWAPNREDVENLTDYARGAIDGIEFDRRADGAAERRARLRAQPSG